jgi:hypothetical protein
VRADAIGAANARSEPIEFPGRVTVRNYDLNQQAVSSRSGPASMAAGFPFAAAIAASGFTKFACGLPATAYFAG